MHGLHSYPVFIQQVLTKNREAIAQYTGGRLCHYSQNWQKITSNPEILEVVNGYKLDFTSMPVQVHSHSETCFSQQAAKTVQLELDKLVVKQVICACSHTPEEFISRIFLQAKSDGTHRVILNLTHLNKFIADQHFKTETLDTVTSLMKQGSFTGSLDLKDAYHSTPIHLVHTKYLHFSFKNQLWEFLVLPNGLKSRSRIFTKLMQVAFSKLRPSDGEATSLPFI